MDLEITKFINEKFNETLSTIFDFKKKQKLSLDEITEELNKLFIKDSDDSKPKKTKAKKELLNEDRCHALKQDSTRCNGRKQAKGDNPLLCSLHNNNKPKMGLISETTVVSEDEMFSEEFP